MNTIVEHINSAGFSFVEFALPMLVQSGVLIVILLLVDLLLRKKVKAVFRYWIWMLVLVKLILPTSLSSPLSLGYLFGEKLTYQDLAQTSPILKPTEPAPADISPGMDPLFIQPNPYIPPPEPVISVFEPAIAEPVSPPVLLVTPLSWHGVVFLIWLAVVIAMGLLLLQRALFVRGLVAQSKKAGRLMNDALAYCRASMGIKSKVGLKISVNATTPSVCGLIRPVILVPWNLTSTLGASRMRTILMHELAHIRRADLWVNLAQTALQIIYFYNPLLWIANCVIRRIREQAVDEAVLVAMGEKAQKYPQTLVDVAKMAFKRPALSLRLIGVVESKSALAGRIKHILGRPMPKTAKLGIIGLLAIIIAGAVLLPMARAQRQAEPETSVETASLEHFVGKYAIAKHPDTAVFEITKRGDVFIFSDLSGPKFEVGFLLKGLEGHKFEMEKGRDNLKFGDPRYRFSVRYDPSENSYSLDKLDMRGEVQDGFSSPLTELVKIPAEKPEDIYVATLPNGVTVELVGVCELSEGQVQKWWRPDGKPFKKTVFLRPVSYEKNAGLGFMIATDRTVGIKWEIEGTTEHLGTTEIIDSNGQPTVAYKERRERVHFVSTDGRQKTEIILALTPQWHRKIKYDGKYVIEESDPKVKFFETYETAEGLKIIFRNDHRRYGNYLQAVLSNEAAEKRRMKRRERGEFRIHAKIGPVLSRDGEKRLSAFFENIERSDVKYFELSTGPLPEKVVFKNVSLRPGMETDVQAEVEKTASNNSGGDSKRHQHVTFKEGMSIREALRFLANAHKKNIILSNKVAGQVPVNELYNVTFEEALQAILGKHKYIIDGDFIRVYTEEEFESIYPEEKTNSQVEVEKPDVRLGIESNVSPKLVMLIDAINSCAAETDLNIDSISITDRNISIKGNTSDRANTRKFLDAIKDNGLKVSYLRLDAADNRDKFIMNVEPKQDWQKWWQRRKTDVQLGFEETVSPKLIMLLVAINSVAAETDLNIESISVTAKSMSIEGDTSGRTDTLKFLDTIKDNGLEVSRLNLDARNDRDRFRITVEPKKDWRQWWQQHKTDIEADVPAKEDVDSKPPQPELLSTKPPIFAYDVKLNFADPTVRDGTFHSEQSVAFAMAFHNIEIPQADKIFMDHLLIGQTTWPVHLEDNGITIHEGVTGQKVLSLTWPAGESRFEKVIKIPVKYGQKDYSCPVRVQLDRRDKEVPMGSYWFCAYLSGRLPWGAGGRGFEIVNLDQQMEFRLTGDGTDPRDAVLGIDIDGDGKIDPAKTGGEQFDLYKPFQIGPKTYRLAEVDPYLPRVVFRELVSEKSHKPPAKTVVQVEGETTYTGGLRCNAELIKNEVAFGQDPKLAVSLTNTTSEPIDIIGYCRNPNIHSDRYTLPCAQLYISPVGSDQYRIESYGGMRVRHEAIRVAPGKSWSFEFPPPKMKESTTAEEHRFPLPSLRAWPPGKYTAQLSYFIRESEIEKFGPGLVFGAEMGSLAGKKPDRLWRGVVQSKELVFEILDDDSEQLRIRKAIDSGEGVEEHLQLELKASKTKALLSILAKNTGEKSLYLGGHYCLRGRNPMGKERDLGIIGSGPMELKPGATLELGGWNLRTIGPGTYWVEYLSNFQPERVLKKTNTVTFEVTKPDVQAEIDNREDVPANRLIVPGQGVGIFTFGMSTDDMLKSLGKTKGDSLRGAVNSISVDGVILNFIDDSVNSIAVLSPLYKFANGLGIGSSEQQIIQAFGNDFYLKEYEGKDFLTYKDKGLVFEIYKYKRTVMEMSVLKIADPLKPSRIADVQVEVEGADKTLILQTDLKRRYPILLTWPLIQDASKYVVKIKGIRGSRPTTNFESTTNSLNLGKADIAPGRYHWTVSAYDKHGNFISDIKPIEPAEIFAIEDRENGKMALIDLNHSAGHMRGWGFYNHAQYMTKELLENAGFTVEVSERDLLTADKLKSVDLLICHYYWTGWPSFRPYLKSELSAVRQFVEKGGSLLVVGCDRKDGGGKMCEAGNELVKEFGLLFELDKISEQSRLARIVTGQNVISFSKPVPVQLPVSVQGRDSVSLLQFDGVPIVRARQFGKGKVIVAGVGMSFLDCYLGDFEHREPLHLIMFYDFIRYLTAIDWRTNCKQEFIETVLSRCQFQEK